jgi:hypothetical protein
LVLIGPRAFRWNAQNSLRNGNRQTRTGRPKRGEILRGREAL